MFTYFGYGSNINLLALRAKGVEPISSVPGTLKGWRLAFNVQHWFRHEGGMGNIQPVENPDAKVEGMVHFCHDEDLEALDRLEAYGIGYDRVEVAVETAGGEVRAFAYVGLPEFINDSCLPTRRYLNIIVKGAEQAGLSSDYVGILRAHPLFFPEDYVEFELPDQPVKVFQESSLQEYPYFTALAGAVFDMRGCRSQLECLIDIFGGKDMTVFHLKRHDSSDGTETLEDFINGDVSPKAIKYLNAYLHEYNREFKYVGSINYSKFSSHQEQ